MKLKNLILAFACCALVFTACSDDDDNKVIPSDVPEAVLKAFENKYGDIKDVKWEKKNNYNVARFQTGAITKAGNSYTTSAWYDDNGSEKQVNQDIPFANLPEAVKTAFDAYQKKMYADWKADDDVDVVSRLDMGLIYIIEIEKGKEERELSFSPDGVLLKDVLDTDDDDEILPVIVSDEIKKKIAELFPNSKSVVILEIDTDDDDNETEIDILDDGIHKEVKLDAKGNWISTEFETTLPKAMEIMNTLNPAILAKLIAMAGQAGIDLTNPDIIRNTEVTVVDHATKGMYFEVEIEIGDNDLEVIIDKDGNISFDK
ncbi:PepSY-like domain-containing protein [uncultured Parabacteroides sp.]|uniref:PepSY-like domain-containing protein n=1 Tax=uncultured Parabacteroides sp. TaxID=512312 RepID=UPI0025D3455C|nr:PepSY-like domain-containing protein [uncultured Parabacteroides sp.]